MFKMSKEIHQALMTMRDHRAPARMRASGRGPTEDGSITKWTDTVERPSPEKVVEAQRVLEAVSGRQLWEAINGAGADGRHNQYFLG